jgi:hypothetical protein
LSWRDTFGSGDVHETSTAPNVGWLMTLRPLPPGGFARSRAPSTLRPSGGVACVGVEQSDRVVAAVSGEVAVVLVDHRQTRAPMKRERSNIEIPARSAKVA